MPGPRAWHYAVTQHQKWTGTYTYAACGTHGYLIVADTPAEVTCRRCRTTVEHLGRSLRDYEEEEEAND